ncbi:MAG: STAS domain-containing protein [Streptosporangiaceae bacterium]
MATTMTRDENRMAADRAGTEILSMPAELDLVTSEGVVEQGYAAIARSARLLLLDLTGLSFCDARGLGAFVRIANHADAAGCRFGLIAPRPRVEKVLRISGLYSSRMPVFATADEAVALLSATASV